MATRFEMRIQMRGVQGVMRMFARFNSPATRTELHKRWSIQAMNWVNRNFQSQGRLVGGWKALSRNTIAARRQGGKGAKILQDTGRLKQSFTAKYTSARAVVGSNLFYAAYHDQGRKGPWVIRPKRAKFLRFRVAGGGRGRRSAWVFAKQVRHPGIPQRRILPRASDFSFVEALRRTALNYIRELRRG